MNNTGLRVNKMNPEEVHVNSDQISFTANYLSQKKKGRLLSHVYEITSKLIRSPNHLSRTACIRQVNNMLFLK